MNEIEDDGGQQKKKSRCAWEEKREQPDYQVVEIDVAAQQQIEGMAGQQQRQVRQNEEARQKEIPAEARRAKLSAKFRTRKRCHPCLCRTLRSSCAGPPIKNHASEKSVMSAMIPCEITQ